MEEETVKPKPPTKLYMALVKAKQSFGNIKKNKENPHYKSKYADLDAILDATEKHLLANGLLIYSDIAPQMIITYLVHAESGEARSSEYPLNPSLSDQQKGSAITYGRRYCIMCLLNISADEDDDGNATKPEAKNQTQQASKTDSKKQTPPPANSPAGTPPDAKKVNGATILEHLSKELVSLAKEKFPLEALEKVEERWKGKKKEFEAMDIYLKGMEKIKLTRDTFEGTLIEQPAPEATDDTTPAT